MILSVDTSSVTTVMGTGNETAPGRSVQAEGSRRHAEVVDRLFAENFAAEKADFQALTVGIGPGPYAGLRVGIAFAIGLGRALQVPVFGVCSLDARAWQIGKHLADEFPSDQEFGIGSDARRGEIYWARYRSAQGSAPHRIAGPLVISHAPDQDDEMLFTDVVIDPGYLAHQVARLLASGESAVDPHPTLVPHGSDGAASQIPQGPLFTPTPLYLRQPDVTLSVPASSSKVR